jgi:shikimate kinase/3-dehydroquinate synthase
MPTERHLVLVGVMGSGKTETGRRLATQLGREFVDTDALIEAEMGMTVADLFRRRGEAAFRETERRVVADALGATGPAVIATGGGAVLDSESRAAMHEQGIVVWLDPPLPRIAARLEDDGSRPLLSGRPIADELARLREERLPCYEAVAHTRVAIDADVDTVADAVASAIETLEAA